VFICGSFLGLLSSPAVGQEVSVAGEAAATDDSDLQRTFAEGQAAFEAADFATAAARFEAVFAVTGVAEVAFNVALSYDRLDETRRAAEWYGKYLECKVDAPDRAEIEARIAELEAEEGEEEGTPLAPHRVRLSLAWGYYPGGAQAAQAGTTAVDLGGFRFEAGYQWAVLGGLVIDGFFGATFAGEVQGSGRDWDVWCGGVGLGYVWTSLPYVLLALRGDFAFHAVLPTPGDKYYLTAFQAGAWIEVPLLSWLALHAGADFGIGPFVGRDDKAYGLLLDVGGGLTLWFGGEPEPEPAGAAEPRPRSTIRTTPMDELGRGWQ
jgi:hypothetical protein